jgi:hypothetical protein
MVIMKNLMSDQIDQLATALCKAQSEMSVAGKNQKNPFFKSSYADFEAIINASRPALTKNGLSVVQSPMINSEGDANLITILMHSSGQWIQSIAKYNPAKSDIQSLSSYNTYLKRMCYTSLVGVATGDDDDGESAMTRTPQNSTPAQRSFSADQDVELITKDQLEQLEDLLIGHADICQSVLKGLDIERLSLMPKNKFLSSFKRIQEIINTKN